MIGSQPLSARAGLAYGLLGLPLAFVALPLYVLLPNHYAREFGMPLATLGAVLLAARLFDAFTDPLLGRLADHLFGRSVRAVLAVGAASAAVLALGLTSLFFPRVRGPDALTAGTTMKVPMVIGHVSAPGRLTSGAVKSPLRFHALCITASRKPLTCALTKRPATLRNCTALRSLSRM